jgi:hypothetical protein
MSGPNPNPSGCCTMVVSCCAVAPPDIVAATVTGQCGSYSTTLIGQGSGGNSGCWVGSVVMQLKNMGFPPTCVNKTLNLTMCCDPMGNMSMTIDCGGMGSGLATVPQPGCNPMDLTFTNISLPSDCNTMESSIMSIEVTGSVPG